MSKGWSMLKGLSLSMMSGSSMPDGVEEGVEDDG